MGFSSLASACFAHKKCFCLLHVYWIYTHLQWLFSVQIYSHTFISDRDWNKSSLLKEKNVSSVSLLNNFSKESYNTVRGIYPVYTVQIHIGYHWNKICSNWISIVLKVMIRLQAVVICWEFYLLPPTKSCQLLHLWFVVLSKVVVGDEIMPQEINVNHWVSQGQQNKLLYARQTRVEYITRPYSYILAKIK